MILLPTHAENKRVIARAACKVEQIKVLLLKVAETNKLFVKEVGQPSRLSAATAGTQIRRLATRPLYALQLYSERASDTWQCDEGLGLTSERKSVVG